MGTSILLFMRGGLLVRSGLMRSARVGVLPVPTAILSTDEMLSDDLGAGGVNNTGFMMDPSGQCGEAFLLPWWRDGGIDADKSRDAKVRMGERLWDESVVKFYKCLLWFEPMLSITSKIRVRMKAF